MEEEEDNHEKEKEFELIHIDSEDEYDTIIVNSLLQDRNAQIKDLKFELERSKDLIHFLQMQNKKMSGQMAIYEARALKYQKEAQRSQVQLKEYMGTHEESEEEEGQTRRRPRTMGLRKEFAKQREEYSAQAQQFTLTEVLAMEI